MHTHSRTFLFAAALASAAGCLVVSPLDDLPPSKGGGASQGGSGQAGTPVGGSAQAGTADSGNAGQAPGGAGPGNECETNADCVKRAADEPARCRPSDHTCVALKNEACPLAYGNASDPNAIHFGAFATLNPTTPEDNSVIWAHRLALDELSGDLRGGLPDGPDGASRPLVMIVCNNAEDLVEPGVKHLAEDLEVPAVLATLKPGDLRRAFEAYRARDLFYFSPVSVTSPIVALKDEAHIWNLLGQPSDFVATYVELLRLSEAHLRAERNLAPSSPIRVALVTTKDAFDSELASALTPALRFNGSSAVDDAQNFASFTIDDKPDFSQLAAEITAFAPDIVVSAASEQFLMTGGLQQTIEDDWIPATANKARPFYILSPYDAGNLNALIKRISDTLERTPAVPDQERYVGVSIAAAADKTLQNAYALRLGSQFKDAIKDTANYYDAVYYLAYAMYAADQPFGLNGSGIATGMQRLLDGASVDIGPKAAGKTFQALAAKDATLHVTSTLGPPDFDAKTGVRPVDGSVFCFNRQNNAAKLVTDALRYDANAKALVGKAFPCISGFFQP